MKLLQIVQAVPTKKLATTRGPRTVQDGEGLYIAFDGSKPVYIIQREKEQGDKWVARHLEDMRWEDRDQYRLDLFERLEDNYTGVEA